MLCSKGQQEGRQRRTRPGGGMGGGDPPRWGNGGRDQRHLADSNARQTPNSSSDMVCAQLPAVDRAEFEWRTFEKFQEKNVSLFYFSG